MLRAAIRQTRRCGPVRGWIGLNASELIEFLGSDAIRIEELQIGEASLEGELAAIVSDLPTRDLVRAIHREYGKLLQGDGCTASRKRVGYRRLSAEQ